MTTFSNISDYDAIFATVSAETTFTIEKMNTLLETFTIYLDYIMLDNDFDKEFKILYTNKIYRNKLEEYINIIINYYGLSNNERIDIKNRFLHIILSGIIILFSYLYIKNELAQKNITITKYIASIIHINFYEYILKKFIDQMYDSTNYKYELGVVLEILNDNNDLTNYFETEFPKIKVLLDKIIPYIQTINVTNNFITIPQYEGICWFISFLTAICYSDESKKLLLNIYKDKNKENVKNINMITFDENPEITLNSLVYYIIRDITLDFKQYDSYYTTKYCNVFKYFKKNPLLILKQLYNDFIKHNKSVQKRNLLFINNNQYFKSVKEVNKLTNNSIKINDSINHFGIMSTHYNVLNIFYEYMNIKVLYLYLIETTLYIQPHINNDSILIIDPDVIIIDNVDTKFIAQYPRMKPFSAIIEYDKEKFNYNGNEFILDYMLHGNSIKYRCKECEAYGHCISAIHYNNKQYLYNSAELIYRHEYCNDNNIYKIPCSLIEYNWKSAIKSDYCIKLDECHYNNVNVKSKFHKNTDKTFCYAKDADNIFCFVKKQQTPTERLEDLPKHILTNNNSKGQLSQEIFLGKYDDTFIINIINYIIREYNLYFRNFIFKYMRGSDKKVKPEIKEYEEIFIEKFIYLINYPISANNGNINKNLNDFYFNYIILYNTFFYNIIKFCRLEEENDQQLLFIQLNNLLNSIIRYLQLKGSNFEYKVLKLTDYTELDYNKANYEEDIKILSKLKIEKIHTTTGGNNNNKYKNTGNKVTILYNKKKYNRVVYINNRKKYVKINKVYILLSKLKKLI